MNIVDDLERQLNISPRLAEWGRNPHRWTQTKIHLTDAWLESDPETQRVLAECEADGQRRRQREHDEETQLVRLVMAVGGRDEHQRVTRRSVAMDSEPPVDRAYLGRPSTDARAWLGQLATRVDVNGRARAWWRTLREYVYSLPAGALCRDIDAHFVNRCLKEMT